MLEEELPSDALKDAVLQEYKDGASEYRTDVTWYHLRQILSPIGNNVRFHLLFKFVQIIMLIPHSNAGIKRVFSLVNRNKNECSDKNRWDSDEILSSIFSVKFAQPESQSKCSDYQPNKKSL